MSSADLRESTRWNEKVTSLASHGLVVLMLTCVMVTLVQFGEYLLPSWQGGFLPWVTLVVSMEAMYTKRAVGRLNLFSPEWIVYRGAELVVLFLGLKIFLYLLRDPAQLWIDLAGWQEDYLANFFNGEYLIAAMLMFLIWITAGQYAEDLAGLEGDDKLLEGAYPVNVSAERSKIRQELIDRMMAYGAGMVILVSLMRIDLQGFLGFRPRMGSTIINVVAYFVLALALLSLTQLSVLRASWSTQRISLSLNLGSRWLIYSLIFLVGMAALAMFLPTSYTLGLLSFLGLLLSWLIFAIALVGQLLLTLWFIFLSLFGGDQSAARPNPPMPPLTPPSPESAGLPAWLEILRSIMFWVIFLGVSGFSIYQYAKQHGALWDKLWQLPGAAILRKVWWWLRESLRRANRVASTAINNRLARIRSARRAGPLKGVTNFSGLRRLSARQKVLFYYQAMVRRGNEYGISRRPAQTPHEYQVTLQSSLPEIDRDLAAMTAAFYEARYSRHEISEERAGWVRRWWKRIRRSLRK